jgi:uncharacterized protein YnzC (UPF0291/DUF896 family)
MPVERANYYARRARQEHLMAEAAQEAAAKRTHLMLAEQYERIAKGTLREWDQVPR